MPRISTDNYDTVASWNGSQDLFVVEQPDGTKVATPAMVKQFMEAGDFEATGEIIDGHGNILKDMAKSADVDEEIGDLSQTGLTGDSVAEQLTTAKGRIATKVEGSVFSRFDDTSLTAKMDNIKAQNKSGAYVMYCSSANPDFSTIGYCIAIGFTIYGAVSAIVAVNTQTGEIWTNGNTSQNAGDWRGWRKIN